MTGADVIKVRDQLKGQRSCMDSHYQELAELYTPRRWGNEAFNIYPCEDLYTSKPQQCAHTLANGLSSTIIPRKEIFFEFLPPQALEKYEDTKRWYRESSETTRQYLSASNYWEEMGEFLLEFVIYGTAAIFIGDLDDRGEIYFRNQTCGSYYIAEDQYGRVNCFYRDLRLTAEQAAEEFGVDKLSEEIRNKLKQPEGKTEKFNFVHGVGREMQAPEKDAPVSQSKPWYSIVVEEKTKKIAQKKSYSEFPFAVARYRKEAGWPYGFGPGTVAMGDARQISFLNQMGDVGAERNVFPPMVAPASMEGEIEQGPGGLNYVDESNPNQAAMLRELEGRPDLKALEWRLQAKERDLENAFNVPLFSIFSSRAQEGKQPLTATESNLIAGEKIQQISPIYGRLMSEAVDIQLERVFNVLLRAGSFGPPPDSLRDPAAPDRLRIPQPSIRYKNRIELALDSLNNRAFIEFFSTAGVLIEQVPTLLDYFEFDESIPDIARNSGFPERWMRKLSEVHRIQQERAAAQAQQMKLQEAQMASESVKNMSQASPQVQQAAAGAARR